MSSNTPVEVKAVRDVILAKYLHPSDLEPTVTLCTMELKQVSQSLIVIILMHFNRELIRLCKSWVVLITYQISIHILLSFLQTAKTDTEM